MSSRANAIHHIIKTMFTNSEEREVEEADPLPWRQATRS